MSAIAIIAGMKKIGNITESEWPIMRVLWDRGSATAGEIVDAVTRERDVSMRTVKTLLRRLIAKNAAGYAIDPADARLYHYRALVQREEAVREKNASFARQVYQDDMAELLSNFVEDSELSVEELNQLRQIVQKKIDEKKKR